MIDDFAVMPFCLLMVRNSDASFDEKLFLERPFHFVEVFVNPLHVTTNVPKRVVFSVQRCGCVFSKSELDWYSGKVALLALREK